MFASHSAGHDQVVSLILEAHPEGAIRHALMEFATADGATPLMVAAHQGNASVVSRLLSHGANTVVLTSEGTVLTALELASTGGHRECAALVGACEEMRTSGRMSM